MFGSCMRFLTACILLFQGKDIYCNSNHYNTIMGRFASGIYCWFTVVSCCLIGTQAFISKFDITINIVFFISVVCSYSCLLSLTATAKSFVKVLLFNCWHKYIWSAMIFISHLPIKHAFIYSCLKWALGQWNHAPPIRFALRAWNPEINGFTS